ncbi:formimidoylglutamate deiminase [Leptolyngbya sp. FACHB-261]|uniref:formimidoylglutamate deiminase n=1 Tax=Leptolyngbya sp. FACHB-261 TaxID=2692806 RepID=UPI0016884DB7|nr:formimidoylglutamate deiminase [Leptolyngbya sp. FACHB-261]MBD2104842.1 formimidoylglutamate deiminase [Leptolyngbya sp. FACHB-261]
MFSVLAPYALLPDGWAPQVRLEIDDKGLISAVTSNAQTGEGERLAGSVLPGMPNLHSHSFQRAMAGLTERGATGEDSFWTWRQLMYDFVDRLTPEQLEAIAAQLYVELLKAGYTAVGEFHYLHHDPTGAAYAQRSELASRVIGAAQTTGIGLTLLPVLYSYSGFGGIDPAPKQRRFLNDAESFLSLWDELAKTCADDPQLRLGVAPHSLRAVAPELLQEVLAAIDSRDAKAPIHIHVAEQMQEVNDCIAWSGLRPVEWLLNHMPLSPRWCLVHATHMSPDETARLAASGAVVGLCPTTEANLGDGLFPAVDFLRQGGQIGIGSDSHISVNPIEELRWLEYGQRLLHQRRNLLCSAEIPSVGEFLYRRALAGGTQALQRPIGKLAPGCRADLVVLNSEHPALLGRDQTQLLDGLIFSGDNRCVRDVMVGGRWVVQGGRHVLEEPIQACYGAVLAELLS